ncbi:hypothetical protein V2J09_018550 [Rumex salicifolius]
MEFSTEIEPPQEPQRVVFVEDVKMQKEGGNRRALQEISNFVNPSDLPITKSLAALSLAYNDPPAVAKNNDKVIKHKVQGGEAAKAAQQRLQKKVTYKPEPDTIIIISSDEEEDKNLTKVRRDLTEKKHTGLKHRSSRKKINSLTSVLTARSKAACGVESRPRERAVDIDAADVNNELAVVEYVEEIYKFYRISEEEFHMRDYMDWQPNINQKMRMILVDWLIEVHNKFELLPETLYLTIDLMDRYLTRKVVSRRELQLVGISSMLLACKYEEIWAPEVDDFVSIADRAYKREQVLIMEKSILTTLEWNLTVATPYVFLVRFIKATVPSDKEVENMAFYLAESGLMHYDLVVSFRPSLLAASAVFAALRALNRTPSWTETLRHHTGYIDHEIKKFTDPSRGAVALLPLAQ